MRQFRLDYPLKNIPIPSRDNYLRNWIEKVESVLKRMRWKAHFFLNGQKSQEFQVNNLNKERNACNFNDHTPTFPP